MSSEPYTHVEQDPSMPNGDDGLPTYDDLAAQNGPNSRFGRWRGWIEKRAAERYNDMSSEERRRRRERGWGNEPEEPQDSGSVPSILSQPPTPGPGPGPGPLSLHIQTSGLTINDGPSQSHIPSAPDPLLPLPFVCEKLAPTHLKISHFGSRFLPHATSPIRCILPLMSDRLLLIGHDEGLSVLDMFPQEWADSGGITIKGPDEAQARLIWKGESVYQMSILEVEDCGEDTPQGVVLVLVGPESESSSGKESESLRTLRMYNLASLTSLAKWAVAQKGARPLDLHRPSNWQAQQTPTKKHRPQSSFTRSLKSLIDSPSPNHEPNTSSYQTLLSPTGSPGTALNGRRSPSPNRPNFTRRESGESSWDLVEDLPLRWATDFVPLATPGSRLANAPIISYTIWTDENRKGRGGQLLAVSTKYNILLYETPKGERAFRFVKEFYTPLQPRSIVFFQQSVQEVTRSVSDVTPGRSHKRTDSSLTTRGSEARGSIAPTVSYGTQLSLFVVFDKKAGWIRIADAAVGEIELYDDKPEVHHHAHVRESLSVVAAGSGSLRSKARMSFDIVNAAMKWTVPTSCDVPLPGYPDVTRKLQFLTRGKRTHIVYSPVSSHSALYPPLQAILWNSVPRTVTARVCERPSTKDGDELPPFLQLIAFGANGLEVQEISLSFMSRGKGKGKAILEDPLQAEEDLGGDAGFLCNGGHWDQTEKLFNTGLTRSYSATSNMSGFSYDSLESEDLSAKMRKEEGMYGWCRKGVADWRVFWVGGSPSPD